MQSDNYTLERIIYLISAFRLRKKNINSRNDGNGGNRPELTTQIMAAYVINEYSD
jgi:hypothetical protein